MLEALTRVPELAEKYVGKVKLIYIDPPFNTAQTFANYEDNLEHSVWLTMMRDRLLHLKKLMTPPAQIPGKTSKATANQSPTLYNCSVNGIQPVLRGK